MKKIISFFVILVVVFFSVSGCNASSSSFSNEQGSSSQGELNNGETDDDITISLFSDIVLAVNADTSGVFSNIKFGTPAYKAIVEIEKIYKVNTSNITITMMYYYCEVVSLINAYGLWEKQEYYDEAIIYAKQIDLNYSGPFSTDIILLAKKYVDNPLDSNNKNALTMSLDEKMDLKWWINKRYSYYDNIEGKFCGDKYTNIIFEEAAYAYDITTTDVQIIWKDNAVKAIKSNNNYRKENTYPDNTIIIEKLYKSITIGVLPDWAPFEFIDKDGNLSGFEVEFANSIGSIAGIDVVFKQMTEFDELLLALSDMKVDLIMSGMAYTDSRAIIYGHTNVYFSYTDSGNTMNIVGYTRKSDAKLVEQLNNAIMIFKSSEEYQNLKLKYNIQQLNGYFSD